MTQEYSSLLINLAAASGMVALTVLIHFGGLLRLSHLMSGAHARLKTQGERLRQALVILLAVFGVFALHTVEIWSYALCYWRLHEIGTLEAALYFSTVTFATLGYGDLVLSENWRLFASIEAVNGVILVGWSTAFLFTVTSRLRLLEHEWAEPRHPAARDAAATLPNG